MHWKLLPRFAPRAVMLFIPADREPAFPSWRQTRHISHARPLPQIHCLALNIWEAAARRDWAAAGAALELEFLCSGEQKRKVHPKRHSSPSSPPCPCQALCREADKTWTKTQLEPLPETDLEVWRKKSSTLVMFFSEAGLLFYNLDTSGFQPGYKQKPSKFWQKPRRWWAASPVIPFPQERDVYSGSGQHLSLKSPCPQLDSS